LELAFGCVEVLTIGITMWNPVNYDSAGPVPISIAMQNPVVPSAVSISYAYIMQENYKDVLQINSGLLGITFNKQITINF